MSAPLPSVFSPVPPSPESKHHHEHDSEDHDSPHPHHHHRKRERVKSFVKHLVSPFHSPEHHHHHHHHEEGGHSPAHLPQEKGSHSPAHFPQEKGSPTSSITSLSPELGSVPSLLRKRQSSSSARSSMKNQPFPHSSPSSSPFPSSDSSGLSPNPNHSSPKTDHHGSPTRKRERVRSFVNDIRRSSSQLFKKDKKDGWPTSTISALAAESLSLGTAATAPTILRRFSHSKHPSTTSTNTAESDISGNCSTVSVVRVGSENTSPIIEVATPISPVEVQPVTAAPVILLEEEAKEKVLPQETEREVNQCLPTLLDGSLPAEPEPEPTEAASENPDPLVSPLPPSPLSAPSSVVDPVEPIQIFVDEPEVGTTSQGEVGTTSQVEVGTTSQVEVGTTSQVEVDTTSQVGVVTTSPGEVGTTSQGELEAPLHKEVQPPAITSTTPTTSPPGKTSQPSALPSSTPSTPAPFQQLYAPVIIAPMRFWPISNMRLSYFFTPVLVWWLAKGIANYPSLYS